MAIEGEVAKLSRLAKQLEDQKQRVIKLYRFGDVDDDYVQRELRQINRLSADTAATIAELKTRAAMAQDFAPLADRVRTYCERVSPNLAQFGFADTREVPADSRSG